MTQTVITSVTLENAAVRQLEAGGLWFSEKDVVGRKPRIPGIARVLDKRKRTVAMAFLSPDSRYYLRVFSREDADVDRAFWRDRIIKAHGRRKGLFDATDAYRVVYSESDGIPSVVIDRYNDIYSIQITSSGAMQIRNDLVAIIEAEFHPAAIIERRASSIRVDEELEFADRIIYGDKSVTIVKEFDQRFEVDVLAGQKTGAYLDYRSFRRKAGELARGRCLDAFCYQGWLACQIASSADSVVSVDASADAIAHARANAKINSHNNIDFIKADAFDFIESSQDRYDFIHVDPPAMARQHADLPQALRAYKKLARSASALLEKNGLFMISSCSHRISERLLEETVTDGIERAGRSCEVIWRGIQDIDHPVMKGLPEALYLKAIAVKIN